VRDGVVLSETVGDPAVTHGARLPIDIERTLAAASVESAAIDLLAVAAGPGSFTGLRVGIATMQGLAMAMEKRIVPISVLDALAIAGANPHAPVAAWLDAQRGEVFAALYDRTGRRVSIDATALSPEETLRRWRAAGESPTRFIGDGAVRYAAIIRSTLDGSIEIDEPPPLAAIIGRLASESPERAVAPHAIVPIYVRRPDAEIARARQREEARDAG
jgi:tRNA threonylcarbamoyladenosine biosynthesis protein TsaB